MSRYDQKTIDRFAKSEEAFEWFTFMNEEGVLCKNVPEHMKKLFGEAVKESVKKQAWLPKERKYDLRLIDRANPMISSTQIIEFMDNDSLNHVEFSHHLNTVLNFFTTGHFWNEANAVADKVLKDLKLNSADLAPDCLNFLYEVIYQYNVLTTKLIKENNYYPSQTQQR